MQTTESDHCCLVIEFLRKKGAREEAANNFVTRICGEETRPTWELYAGLVTLLLLRQI